jgi:hypothetical protein
VSIPFIMNPIEAARESAMKRQHLMPSLPLGVAKASFVAKLKENKDGPRGGAMHGEEIVKSIGGNVDLLANVAFMARFGEFLLLVILLKKKVPSSFQKAFVRSRVCKCWMGGCTNTCPNMPMRVRRELR